MCTFNAIGQSVDILLSTFQSYSKIKSNADYRVQIALNNAKNANNQALREKQLGIEKSRLEKISGLSEASKIKAINSASNLDSSSQTNNLNYLDAINLSYSNSQNIKNNYDIKAQSYFDKANSYINQANMYEKNYNNSLLAFADNALGKTQKVSANWYSNNSTNSFLGGFKNGNL